MAEDEARHALDVYAVQLLDAVTDGAITKAEATRAMELALRGTVAA